MQGIILFPVLCAYYRNIFTPDQNNFKKDLIFSAELYIIVEQLKNTFFI